MSEKSHDEKALEVEVAISTVLHWGVTGSLVLLGAGTLLCFAKAGTYGNDAAALHAMLANGNAFPRNLAWFLGGLVHLDGTAVIVAGLLLLIATPVIRVAISIGAFIIARDRAYALITTFVLLLLMLSFYLGKAG